MPLSLGVLVLALAVFIGGAAALVRHRSERAMHAVRTFAVVAAASIALLHLLPETLNEIGWPALIAAAAGFLAPALLERLFTAEHGPGSRAPTTVLSMGYAAVIAHQLGEGAAVASLARVGSLSASIVLAIAAHTVPLAMVVAIRVLEVKGETGGKRALLLALFGVAVATVIGAFATRIIGVAQIETVEPWLIATVAGILLHAFSHEALTSRATTFTDRVIEAFAGLAGLALAVSGVEETGWIQTIPWSLRIVGVVVLAGLILARSFVLVRWRRQPHAHRH